MTSTCQHCGACCRGVWQVWLTAADLAREPRLRTHITHTHYSGHEVMPTTPACPFLSAANDCSIYQTRPDCCRDMPPGGYGCRVARGEQA